MRRRVLRSVVGVAIGAAFALSLAGIVLTGPVVIRVPQGPTGPSPSLVRLRVDVEHLCREYPVRDARDPASLRRAADWIADRMRGAGLTVETQDYEILGQRFRNVIGVRRGDDPSANVRVVGAHYDAFPGLPGADDNASGVAVLLEVARNLPESPPRATQYFVAFSTGAPPRIGTEGMGSDVFARSLADRGVGVDIMVSLDSVGYFSDAPRSQKSPLPGMPFVYPRRGDFIAVVGDFASGSTIERVKRALLAAKSIPVRSLRGPSDWAPVARSDHRAFRAHGFPAVRITDTSYLRHPHFHSAGDTPRHLNYERMARVTAALHLLMRD